MGYVAVKFVRHGEAEHVLTPAIVAGQAAYSQLTSRGKEQAARLGELWRREKYLPDIADSSPLDRCVHTMKLALGGLGMTRSITMRPELVEKSQGEHEGMLRSAVYTPDVLNSMERLGGDWRSPGYNSEGYAGESLRDVSERMLGYLSSFGSSARSEKLHVVASTHNVAIRALLAGLDAGATEGPVDPFALHQHFMKGMPPIVPCSQTLVIVDSSFDDKLRCSIEYRGLA